MHWSGVAEPMTFRTARRLTRGDSTSAPELLEAGLPEPEAHSIYWSLALDAYKYKLHGPAPAPAADCDPAEDIRAKRDVGVPGLVSSAAASCTKGCAAVEKTRTECSYLSIQ
jgi:hypothetical protein